MKPTILDLARMRQAAKDAHEAYCRRIEANGVEQGDDPLTR